MREILFRGKRKDNGEWIEGDLLHDRFIFSNEKICRIYNEESKLTHREDVVIPETVGQYTGLTDKNGKKIFEGDIVDVLYDANYAGVAAERIGKFEVVFDRGCFMKRKIDGFGLFHFIASDVHTVIGNIYDNPELLKGEEEENA